jgi:hypothetical protein
VRPLPLCEIRQHSLAADARSHYAPAPCVHGEGHTHPPEHSESAPPQDGKANHCRQEQRGDDKSQDVDHGYKVLRDVGLGARTIEFSIITDSVVLMRTAGVPKSGDSQQPLYVPPEVMEPEKLGQSLVERADDGDIEQPQAPTVARTRALQEIILFMLERKV